MLLEKSIYYFVIPESESEIYDTNKVKDPNITKYRRVIDRNNHYVSFKMKEYFTRLGQKIYYNQYGKPMINDGNFNISHDGSMVVGMECRHKDVGIDVVELNRDVGVHMFQGIFCKDEEHTLQVFSMKEAIVKMMGTGLSTELNRIYITKNKEVYLDGKQVDCTLQTIVFGDYFIAVVVKGMKIYKLNLVPFILTLT